MNIQQERDLVEAIENLLPNVDSYLSLMGYGSTYRQCMYAAVRTLLALREIKPGALEGQLPQIEKHIVKEA